MEAFHGNTYFKGVNIPVPEANVRRKSDDKLVITILLIQEPLATRFGSYSQQAQSFLEVYHNYLIPVDKFYIIGLPCNGSFWPYDL